MPRRKADPKAPAEADTAALDPSAAPGDNLTLTAETRPEPFPRKEEDAPLSAAPRSLAVKLDAEGNPMWEKMRAETKERFARIFSDPATAQQLGIAAPGEMEGPEIFKPEATGPIYDALGHVEALLFSLLLKLDHQKAKMIFSYSQQEKDALAGPTARVINKYSPAWIKERSDEVGLALLLGTLTVQKVQLALAARQALNAQAEVGAGTEGPTGHGPNGAGKTEEVTQ